MNTRFKKLIYFYKKANTEDIILEDASDLLKENTLEVQEALISAGYSLPSYGADGLLGPETHKALLQFKKDNNLPESISLSENEFSILKKSKKTKPLTGSESTSENSNSLLFGDSQMQGGIGKVLESKYGGKRLYKAGSTASYWINNQDLMSELSRKPKRIIVQLNSNGISGTSELLKKIKDITPESEIIWYGAPPAILRETSSYKQVTTPAKLIQFNNNRQSLNKEVAGMLASSGLNARLIDPYTSIFDMSNNQPYTCSNCDGIHVPQSIAQKFYS